MQSTIVKVKDGRVVEGYIYEQRIPDGYLTLMASFSREYDGEKLYFRDMVSCVTKRQMISPTKIADVDELARWREFQETGIAP